MDMEAAGDGDMEAAGDADINETWWKPDAGTLKWEAWAKEEKKKTEIVKEEQREKKWKEVQKKKEIVKEEQSGKNAMGPLTKEAVGPNCGQASMTPT